VLGFSHGEPTDVEIMKAYRQRARAFHPDKAGGDGAKMTRLNQAKDNMMGRNNDRATNVLFVGNPGVGKSTLLNGLVGKCVFKSGASYGGGLTYKFVAHKNEGSSITYMDTPGLADVAMRKKAAEEITRSLMQGGHYKIFFVVTLESGRLRREDITTLKLILESAPISQNYAIIINKVSDRVATELMKNPKAENPSPMDRILAELFAALPSSTEHYMINLSENELIDKDDVVPDVGAEMRKFIDEMPTTFLKKESVKDIKFERFEAMVEQLEKALANLQTDNEALRRLMVEKDTQLQRIKEEMRELQAKQPCTIL